MAGRVVCWSCGSPLDGVPRPIRRHTLCPECRADLHVCRMCVHFDRHLIGQCAHDRADKVLDKTQANYCTYYSPRPNAYEASGAAAEDASLGELERLFGLAGGPVPEEKSEAPPVASRESPQAVRDKARAELERLFGLQTPKRSGGASSEEEG